eukprot:scaffold650642_cov36-Prasinocladus_malaysianus.AAC.1
MAQFDGLCDGVWSAAKPGHNLTYWELYVLQSVGDLYDLTVLFPQNDTSVYLEGTAESERHYTPGHGALGSDGYGAGELLECSALIKLATDSSAVQRRMLSSGTAIRRPRHADEANFWAGHTTWRPFYAMVRTWKIYDLPWGESGPVSVSSSPGFVGYSKDDW